MTVQKKQLKILGIFCLFLWCIILDLSGKIVAGTPVYLSDTGIGAFLGGVIGTLMISWLVSWLIEKFRPAINFIHRLRRIAVTAFVINIFSIFGQMEETGTSTEDATLTLIGLIIIGTLVAAAIFVVFILFRYGRRSIAIAAIQWRSRSRGFRAWIFLSFFWAVGIFLFVSLFDPYSAGSLTYLSDENILHLVQVITLPPIFLGGLWFGFRRFVL
jgi:hypothetical protein